MLENQVDNIYLAIGSNLGNKKINIEQAKFELIKNNIWIEKSSNYYESLSWPDPSNPKFLNIVLKVKTNLAPRNLIQICKKIEVSLGRKKGKRNAPRECDIDIIDYNNQKTSNKINLPHKLMHKRNFVLLPLFEIQKNWIHPIKKIDVKTLISHLSDRDIRSIKQI